MVRVLCTALNGESGPHFQMLADAGHECHVPDRSRDLWNNEVLIDTLKGKGPFTVLAPADAAFAKLPAGTVESLVKPEAKATLTGILTYHVIAGKHLAADVMKMTSAATVNGQSVAIKVADGKVHIGNATVVTADIVCDNGVIHVIDSVLMPK